MRKVKREVKIGNVVIGGHNPVAVQTMLNVPVADIPGNVAQAKRVVEAGCQILRASVPSLEDVRIVEAVKNAVDVPFVADIHFNYKIALACVDAGVDKIRINPGNIGADENVRAVARACNAKNIPIRIGVNAGSLEKEILAKYGAPVPEALVESAMYHVALLEKHDFNNIVISIKSSNVPTMMQAYRLLSEKCDYPLHVGVTEAGTYRMGLIKSGMGIGGLLLEGIGDDRGQTAEVSFQNENLAAMVNGEIKATVPDLICLVDPETFTPVTTEALKYGKRVLVVGLKCYEMWRSEKGLELVGPRYFGVDTDYIPLEERVKGGAEHV